MYLCSYRLMPNGAIVSVKENYHNTVKCESPHCPRSQDQVNFRILSCTIEVRGCNTRMIPKLGQGVKSYLGAGPLPPEIRLTGWELSQNAEINSFTVQTSHSSHQTSSECYFGTKPVISHILAHLQQLLSFSDLPHLSMLTSQKCMDKIELIYQEKISPTAFNQV